jgi:glycosyltransferase involved in cell wall biosynthesis
MVVFAPYPYSETRVQREAEALVNRGYEVDVICPSRLHDVAIDRHGGVNIYRVRKKWRRSKSLVAQFFNYVAFFYLASLKLVDLNRRRHYNVIQAHNVPDFLVFAALVPKLSGARVILDLHDLMPEIYQGRSGLAANSLRVRLILLQERLCCRFADHVITVTEHWRQALIRRGVPPDKCSVVMNLADDRIFRQLPARAPAFGDEDRFRLFYHGYMPERYGLDLVLQAMQQVRAQIPYIHLTLVGAGEHLDTLKKLAEDMKLMGKHVEFLHGVPVEKLPPLITAADVGVVPYRNDAFTASLLPTKLMEYAAMGLPAIVARTYAISKYFDDTMVEFFEPDNAKDLARCIIKLHADRRRMADLAQGIRRFNERFNWSMESDKYVSVVDKLTA